MLRITNPPPPVFNKSNSLGIANPNRHFWTNQNELCIRNSWDELWEISRRNLKHSSIYYQCGTNLCMKRSRDKTNEIRNCKGKKWRLIETQNETWEMGSNEDKKNPIDRQTAQSADVWQRWGARKKHPLLDRWRWRNKCSFLQDQSAHSCKINPARSILFISFEIFMIIIICNSL